VQKKGIVINVVAADLAHYGRTNHDISVHQLASLSNPD
jgi:hypothetical protein